MDGGFRCSRYLWWDDWAKQHQKAIEAMNRSPDLLAQSKGNSFAVKGPRTSLTPSSSPPPPAPRQQLTSPN